MPTSDRLDQSLIPGVRGGLTLTQIVLMTWSRRGIVVAVAGLIVVLAIVASFLQAKMYASSAVILIDFKTDDPVTGERYPAFLANSYIATQIDLMKSQPVRIDVVKRLNLTEEPDFQEFLASREKPGDPVEAVAKRIRENLEVRSGPDSRFINVTYVDADPDRAARIANEWVKAYRDAQLDLTVNPARSRQSEYTEHLETLSDAVAEAEERLSRAKQDLGVIETRQGESVETDRLRSMSIRLSELEANREALQAEVRRIRELEQRGEPLTAQAEILDSRYVQELKGRLVRLQTQLADAAETLGPRHPERMALESQINTVRAQLSQEITAYVRAKQNAAQTAAEKAAAIEQRLKQERRSTLAQQRNRDKISRYQRELQAATEVYEASLSGYDRVLSGSQLQQSNVSIVSWAQPPQEPESLGKKMIVMAALVAGLMVGVMLAFLIELLNRRVHCSEDVVRELDVPVLAETSV